MSRLVVGHIIFSPEPPLPGRPRPWRWRYDDSLPAPDKEPPSMSFNVEFTAASATSAAQIVAEEHLPDSVRTFLAQAISGCAGSPVYVKAVGHLYKNDYQVSTVQIVVSRVDFRAPKQPLPDSQ